jgi:FKBP-type peptidyl-prolyl cis-trans isomerase (trigger factor)
MLANRANLLQMWYKGAMQSQNVKVSKDAERWELELRGEIPVDALKKYRAEALREITAEAKIDGFRPGKAPESVILKHYGEQALLEHAAEHAVKDEIPEILAQEKANIVESPRVSIEPPVVGEPLKFVARAPLAPETKLPDYKKIAEAKNAEKVEAVVSDEEHAQTMTHLKREKVRVQALEAGRDPAGAIEEARKMAEGDLPALDDEFVKSLGYESVDKFSAVVRENLKNEKELKETEKRRAALLDELVKASEIKYPALLKEYELDDMEARMAGDLERMGTTLEKYLASVKKTIADVRKEWEPQADERAKVRLVLSEIARAESISVDPERLAHEMSHAKEHYPQANDAALRAHISHALRNEAVINFLEGKAAEPNPHVH